MKRQLKSKAIFLFAFFTAGILLVSCNCIEGEGPLVEQGRKLSYFDEVELRMGADVILKQDSVFSLTINAQENLLKLIRTEVKGEKLIIDTENGCIRSGKRIEFFITLPVLKSLEIDGSGSMSSEGSFTVDRIDIDINGSGDVQFDLVANRINTDISGSGRVYLSGTANDHRIDINGSGDVNAFGLTTYKANVHVSGSGDCELDVHKKLSVKVSGSGDVYYKGSPDINTRISGSGSVNKQ